MSRLFFVSAFRNLLHHKVQSLISLASLAIGLAVFGFTFLYVKQELSYDRSWPDAERIHRLVIEQRGIPGLRDGLSTSVLARDYPGLMEYFAPQIDKATRLTVLGGRFKDSTTTNMAPLMLVDPEFLDIFQLEVVAGDLERALSGPGFIAVEESYAATLGNNLAPGDRVVIASSYDGELEYEVAAIYRLPEDISVRFSLLTLMHESSLPLFGNRRAESWENRIQVWLKLKPEVDTATFNDMQATYIDLAVTIYEEVLGAGKNINDFLFYRWQPITEIHFNPVDSEARTAGDPARVATFAIVGLLVLLVGCSNSVSLSLASAMERQREIGVRKTMGALPEDILRQHLGESVLFALIALVPAIALLELLLPAFQTLLPFVTQFDAGWDEYALLTFIACIVGLANGAYPALILSRVRPQAVLKTGSGSNLNSRLNLRSLLVGAQFCFASMLLIGTAALYLQLAVTRAQPLGFSAENLAILSLSDQERANAAALGVELEKIPGVIRVVPWNTRPNPNFTDAITLARQSSDIEGIETVVVFFFPGFFEIMNIPLLAGRIPDLVPDAVQPAQNGTTTQPQERPWIINRSAMQALGFASPEEAIEQVVFERNTERRTGQISHTPVRIVGVVEDNMYMSLRRMPGPELYIQQAPDGYIPGLLVKYEEVIGDTLQERIQQTAQAVNAQRLQDLRFVEPELQAAFRQEQNESRLLLICGGLALLLACIGLYGLATFAIERRVKEVGVRKVMGASVLNIVALYLWRFSRPVFIANLLAWPFAIYFVLQWIERFPYQMEKSWLLPLCLGTALVVLLISLFTVSIITARAATANPVKSLRYE
jgi:putative ABC transport system permease protein